MPRLVIDARTLRPGMSGVGFWTLELTRAVLRLAGQSGGWDVQAITLPDWSRTPFALIEQTFSAGQRVVVPVDYESHPGGDWWLHGGGLGRLLRRLRADVYFSPTFHVPWRAPCPTIATLLDFIAWRFPQTYPAGFRYYVRGMSHLAARRANALVVISRSCGHDARVLLGAHRQKLTLLYPGVSGEFHPVSEAERLAVRAAQELPAEPYFMWLGNIETRKGLPTALRAFERLRDEGREVSWVVVGRVAPGGKSHARLLEQSRHSKRILWRTQFPREVLPALLSGATGLLFPSHYEGFGLPAVEAMACGTPVLGGKAGAIPEVLGDAGLLIRPGDDAGLAEGMKRLLDDPLLRENLGKMGVRRAAAFRWETAAERLLALADSLVCGGRAPFPDRSR